MGGELDLVRPRSRQAHAQLAALGGCLCLLFLGALSPTAMAAPLTPSSPLYNPGAPLVNENPDVVAEYSGTMLEVWE